MSDRIPDGYYTGRAVKASQQWTDSKAGNQTMVLSFRLSTPGYEGLMVQWFATFTTGTAKRIAESLRACGVTSDDVRDLTGVEDFDVQLDISNEDYEGNRRCRVNWVNDPDRAASFKASDPAKVAANADRMRGLMAQIPVKPRPNGAAPAQQNLAPQVASDPIPF